MIYKINFYILVLAFIYAGITGNTEMRNGCFMGAVILALLSILNGR